MAISTEIVGREFGPFVREYTFKDLEICALGCNAGFDGQTDLIYVNEHDAAHPDLKAVSYTHLDVYKRQAMAGVL